MTVNSAYKGYFTVEAALIMPVILGVIVLFVYIPMFFFDRCTIEHTVRTACIRAASSGEDSIAEDYVGSKLSEDLLLRWEIETDVSSGEDEVTVSVEAAPELFGRRFVHSAAALKHFCPNY